LKFRNLRQPLDFWFYTVAMRRIVVLGCSGSGKTTLAVQIGQRLGLPVVSLDALYWLPGWRVPDTESFLSRVAEALTEDAWVSEGNYRETFPLRLPRADAVIILQCPRRLRLWRVLRRSIFERGKRVDLPAGCPERTDWPLLKFIWRFDRATWPRIDAARIEHGATVPTYWLRSRRQISDFLGALPEGTTSNSVSTGEAGAVDRPDGAALHPGRNGVGTSRPGRTP
jgi:adenylate kinase family enzyme